MSHEHDPTARAGFSDWSKAATRLGNRALSAMIEKLDPGDTLTGRNAHRAIIDRLDELALPRHTFIATSCGNFLSNPDFFFSQLAPGEYFFASIIPGTHLAHGLSQDAVVAFVRNAVEDSPQLTDKELYLSCNGEPVMSGHIIISADAEPNSLTAEFTVGNFNQFHRGAHTPEIIIRRNEGSRLNWDFRDRLASDGAWQTTDCFTCSNGTTLTRSQMASLICQSIAKIPHDGDYYLPSYYEVLLEHQPDDTIHPVFIEAVTNYEKYSATTISEAI